MTYKRCFFTDFCHVATLFATSYKGLILSLMLFIAGCVSHNHAPVRDLEKPQKVSWGQHRVIKGETLYSIAWRYGRDYRDLAAINGIAAPYLLKPGQLIRLHGAKNYTPSVKQTVAVKPKRTSTVNKATKQNKVTVAGPVQWRWPARGRVVGTFSKWANNKGIDIAAPKGTPVLAAAAGSVVYAGGGLIGYGNLVIIKHDARYLSAYAHNQRILVSEKDFVKAGEKIAEIGSTGSNNVKLHFEIRKNGDPVNPLSYLPKQ